MSRPLRTHIAGGWYHVFSRGLERRSIFRTDTDRKRFLYLLSEARDRYRFVIHAYVLMGNHYHCIIETPDANLSQGMQWLHTSYSTWFNAKHQRVGPLFQGRYRAIPVEGSSWAYDLSFYLHLNPLRIKGLGLDKRGRIEQSMGLRPPTLEIVGERLQRLRTYPWSSYRSYADYAKAPEWLTTKTLLERAHAIVGERPKAYREEAKERLSYGQAPGREEQLRDTIAI
jgi:putative transposase